MEGASSVLADTTHSEWAFPAAKIFKTIGIRQVHSMSFPKPRLKDDLTPARPDNGDCIIIAKCKGIEGPGMVDAMKVQGPQVGKPSRYEAWSAGDGAAFLETCPKICEHPDDGNKLAYFTRLSRPRKEAATEPTRLDPMAALAGEGGDSSDAAWKKGHENVVRIRCLQFARGAQSDITAASLDFTSTPEDPTVIAQADRDMNIGAQGWAGKFQPHWRPFSAEMRKELVRLFVASKISAATASQLCQWPDKPDLAGFQSGLQELDWTGFESSSVFWGQLD